MLSLFDGPRPLSRRQLLRIGSLGLAGLSLPSLLATRARGGEADPLSGKSVIFLFQQGGPSQFETFDPKVDAPEATRTVTGVTKTSLPGVIFGDTMQRLAPLADKFTVVRSYQSGNAGHNIVPVVSKDTLDANIGVHYARVAGATRAETGMPTNAILYPKAVDDTVPGPSARGNLLATGPYGSSYVPFSPGSGGQLQKDMQLHLPKGRLLDDRQALLGRLDRLRHQVDASGQMAAYDEIRQQAYQLLLGGGVREALDLDREDPRVVARYDTSHLAHATKWNHVNRGRAGLYTAQAKTIGKLLLLARRLCEAGCGFVTIHAGYAGVWDMHADGNNLNMLDGMQAVGRSFDHAVAAFIEDLEQRGLSDKFMLMATGEMGRTPRINARGGRDHWARLTPLFFYGGGAGRGQVIGQSDRQGGQPAGDAYTPANLISTLLHTVFDVGQLRLVPGVPNEVTRLVVPKPIDGVIG